MLRCVNVRCGVNDVKWFKILDMSDLVTLDVLDEVR